jgi:hypothetical protein
MTSLEKKKNGIGLTVASFHMEGKALIWFQEIDARCFGSWVDFVEALEGRFGKDTMIFSKFRT